MAEEARLESVYTPKAYPEFESRSLRQKSIKSKSRKQKNCLWDFLLVNLCLVSIDQLEFYGFSVGGDDEALRGYAGFISLVTQDASCCLTMVYRFHVYGYNTEMTLKMERIIFFISRIIFRKIQLGDRQGPERKQIVYQYIHRYGLIHGQCL